MLRPAPEPYLTVGEDALLSDLLALITTSLGVDLAFISRVDDCTLHFDYVHDRGGLGLPAGSTMPLPDTYCATMLARDAPAQAIADTRADPEFARLPSTRDLGVRSYSGVPIVGADGTTAGTLCTLHRRPRTIPASEITLLTLAARVVAQTFAADAARDAARRLEQERENLLSAILHDLKTPLTSVRGYTQMAQRQAERLDAAHTDLPRYLGQIDQGTTRLLGLIDELTDATRARLGQELALHLLPTDVVALARGVVAQHAGLTAHRVTIAASPPALDAAVDAARLERVLDNMLANALKYSPAGGDIEVRVTREGDAAVIAVRDHGLGIPAADLPHIFAPFQRGSNVGRIEGTGMGLAGARHIVEAHGGVLTVESAEGVGSTFTVRLPLDAP
jgi:signal transduction histidine kinase